MSNVVYISQVEGFLEQVTGFPVGELSELHMSAGRITFITTVHPTTGARQVGTLVIQPDPEPDGGEEVAEVIEEVDDNNDNPDGTA